MFIPEPKFYLKDKDAKEPTLIYMQAKYTGNKAERLMLSTGDKVSPSEWDDKKQRAITSKKSLLNGDLNLWLDKMATAFKTVFRSYLLEGKVPTALELKNKIEETLSVKPINISKDSGHVTLVTFIKTYIQDNKAFKSTATITSYTSTLVRIKQFESISNKKFEFDDVDLDWRTGFLKFLQSLGFGRNTEGKHIKNLKVFLNEATERGINKNMIFKSRSFRRPTEDVYKIFLTKEEINVIANLNLQNDRLKEIVRDYFVIGCSTSLRYSDLVRIRRENVRGTFICMITAKTGQEVVIPISPLVQSIFEKYDFVLPKAPCNQVFNRCTKEVGKIAGLTEKVTFTKTIGGVKQTLSKEKWQLLSSHVGRRSLVSNCILEGINTSSIMLISGHKSHKVFQGYVRVNQQQNAEVLSKHPFFKD